MAPASDSPAATRRATFGAGCFWSPEAAFRNLPGVVDAAVGYAGGHVDDPTYQQVCTGTTGHAEVVEVEYDPAEITYDELLEAFWSMHDPTQLDRQGPDVGSQYRSVIFTHSEEQAEAAERSRDAAQTRFSSPIVTRIEPAGTFWRAEDYHQRYLERRGLASCRI